MRNVTPKALGILLFTVLFIRLEAQTLVNKEWEHQHSSPDSIDWSASTTDSHHHLITTGNTIAGNSSYADIQITKYLEDGSLDWQTTWDSPNSKSDYGVAICTDINNNIFIAGASEYSNDSTFDIVLLKYNSQGTLEWATNYNGHSSTPVQDYPLALTIDSVGNSYITGASESSNALDFMTLKFDIDGQLTWEARYDYNGYDDVGADIIVDYFGENVTVTGGSAYSNSQWDYTTILYDYYGDPVNVNREPADEADLEKPKDIVKDKYKNYYITGMSHNSNDYDIKILKLDSTLLPQWTQVYHELNEGSNCLAKDNSDNLYIGGWQEESPGYRHFLLLKYSNSGNLEWAEKLWPDDNKPMAEITGLEVGDENISVVGFMTDGYDADIVTAQYSLDGELQWMKTWAGLANSIDHPKSVVQIDEDIYVSGRMDKSNVSEWVTIKYSFFERDTTAVYNDGGKPLYTKNELIVRFDTSVVKANAVDNTNNIEAEFGNLEYFLKEQVVEAI